MENSTMVIEKPKVFISYAWGDQDYQQRVLAFAESLMGDGIDVLLDKWSLKEGNNTYAFMERSVTDNSVTNVLILIDPLYEKRANTRQGGVGTETQIITPEIYNKTEQTKFLPVIFARYDDNKIPKPVFLNGTLHFDLSVEDIYDAEYARLVKRLYGKETYKKPSLGKMPNWVNDSTDSVKPRQLIKYDSIKNATSSVDREIAFKESLNGLKTKLIEHVHSTEDATDPIDMYKQLIVIRDELLALLKVLPYVRKAVESVADMFEDCHIQISKSSDLCSLTKQTLLHELFIYFVAICYKGELYEELGYVFNRYYYSGKYNHEMESFNIFYCYNQQLNQAINNRDENRYFSGTANYWIDSIAIDICNKKEFVFADLLLFNASIFTHKEYSDWYWFPLTYVYMTNEYDSLMKKFSLQLHSTRKAKKAASMFGFESVDEFKSAFSRIANGDGRERDFRNVRYNESFESPQTIFQFIDAESIASTR